MEENICQYCESKCNIKNREPIMAIIRSRYVCALCFDEFKLDNKKRHDMGIDIPNSFRKI